MLSNEKALAEKLLEHLNDLSSVLQRVQDVAGEATAVAALMRTLEDTTTMAGGIPAVLNDIYGQTRTFVGRTESAKTIIEVLIDRLSS